MSDEKKKVLVIGCINPMSAARAYLNAIKENTDIVIEYFDTEGSFRGLNYDTIIVDDWIGELKAQELIASEIVSLQPTNPNFAKESWRKKK